MKVSLVILTLDEIDGMRLIMPRIRRDWYDELIIVDGGSTDGTVEYAKENGYFLFRQEGEGFNAAIMQGIAKATGDIVIAFSPDGNSVPEYIPLLVEKMKEGYDMVICSRYLKGAKSYDDDVLSAFGNRTFTGLVNLLFRANVTDSLVMYRAYRKNVLDKLKIEDKTGCFGTQFLLRALRKKLKIGEIPGDEPIRMGGVRKMRPLRDTHGELTTLFREYFRRKY